MKKLILMMLIIFVVSGCVSQNSYILYDNRGCAFIVTRYKDGDGISMDTWRLGELYHANIQRLSTEDKPTCPLKKD